MANYINKDDPRAFLYLKELKAKLSKYAKTDPRFNGMSQCGRHLIRLGFKADKKDRAKALKDIS